MQLLFVTLATSCTRKGNGNVAHCCLFGVTVQVSAYRSSCIVEACALDDGCCGSPLTQRSLSSRLSPPFSLNLLSKADLTRKETTMVCCSANWGAGGYLSVRPNNNNNNNNNNTDPTRGQPATAEEAAAAADFAELSLVDATLANKPRAAVFRVVDCEGYTPQPFVGGRLVRNPGPPSGGGGLGGQRQPPRAVGGKGW